MESYASYTGIRDLLLILLKHAKELEKVKFLS